MAEKQKKVLMLFDMPERPEPGTNFSRVLQHPDWKDERDVYKALQQLGYNVALYGIYDDLPALMRTLEEEKPDVVFSLCESFYNERTFAPNLVSLLELTQIPFTGAPSTPLLLCRDKSLSKKILNFHDILTPEFVVSHQERPIKTVRNFPFPAIVKPLGFEGSEGITKNSFVRSESECLDQVGRIHERYNSDVIVEQFIPGRELYVGVMGNRKLTVFPPREFVVEKSSAQEMEFATYKAKWDENYRKKLGIKNVKARPLTPEVMQSIIDSCKKIYRLFQLRGYARMDLRVTADGKVYFIEANPNPGIARDDDFAGGAKLAGMSYEELIAQIVSLAAA